MRRTATAVAPILLSVLVGQAAWGQTTTSSTSTTAPAPSTTTTTTVSGGGERPPAAVLASAAGAVTAVEGSSCWRQPNALTTVCTAVLIEEIPQMLTVRQDEILTLTFHSTMSPTSISLQRFERLGGPALEMQTVPAGNPVRLRAGLPAGVWILAALTDWAQGDASYFFEVNVRGASGSPTPAPPAKPTRAPPRFTG